MSSAKIALILTLRMLGLSLSYERLAMAAAAVAAAAVAAAAVAAATAVEAAGFMRHAAFMEAATQAGMSAP